MITKKYILVVLLLGSFVILSSCSKNFVCKCESTNTLDGSVHTSYINMEGKNKNQVESDCINMNEHWSIIKTCCLD